MKTESYSQRILDQLNIFIMMSFAGRDEDACDAINKAKQLALESIDYEKQIAKHAAGGSGQVRAFFNYGTACEWVATFSDEKTYDACFDQLEKMAKSNGCKLTESLDWMED